MPPVRILPALAVLIAFLVVSPLSAGYVASPASAYVCNSSRSPKTIRVQVQSRQGNLLTLRVTKTKDVCSDGGTFVSGGRIEIRESSRTGKTVGWKEYASPTPTKPLSEVIVTTSLSFTSGAKDYYVVVSSDVNAYWDGPVRVTATAEPITTQLPVAYQEGNLGWTFLAKADYPGSNGIYYVFHPAVDINVAGDEKGTVPVFAIAAGSVFAVSGSTQWGGVILKHTIGGRTYYSQYAHINHLTPELVMNAAVKKGDRIGYIGENGSPKQPHLHFAILTEFHPNPGSANFWYPAQELQIRRYTFKSYESPLAFVKSYLTLTPTIIVEDAATYPGIDYDISDNKVVIDGLAVKTRFFKPANLIEVNGGALATTGEGRAFEANFHYVPTTPNPVETAAGKWFFDVPVAGTYEVYASIPSEKATTKSARYEIFHNGGSEYKTIDQSTVTGTLEARWRSLGSFYFVAGTGQYVKLRNNTGEKDRFIAFDAIKLIRRY